MWALPATSVPKRFRNTLKELNISKGAGKLSAPSKLSTTVCIRLNVDAESEQKLHLTRARYRDACHLLVDFVCKDPAQRNWQRFNLHHAAYHTVRATMPDLGSQMLCNAIRSVSSAYKAELSKHPRKNKTDPLKRIVFKIPPSIWIRIPLLITPS